MDKRRKKLLVGTKTEIVEDGERLPNMGSEDCYKYLGSLVGADGKRRSYGRVLEEGILQLSRAS